MCGSRKAEAEVSVWLFRRYRDAVKYTFGFLRSKKAVAKKNGKKLKVSIVRSVRNVFIFDEYSFTSQDSKTDGLEECLMIGVSVRVT